MANHKVNSDKLVAALSDYQNGSSVKSIALNYGISTTTLYRELKHLCINTKDKRLSNSEEIEIIREYSSGASAKSIQKKYNISRTTIFNVLIRNEISYRSEHGRKHKFNQRYFKNIDTEEKAYWLGFIYADGCVSQINNYDKVPGRLSINISLKDKEILERFVFDINSNYPIVEYIPHETTYSDHPMCRVSFASVKLCSDLFSHGVIPAKTDKLLFPYHSMDKSLYRHFIRGYFDGDGSVSRPCQMSIDGCPNFMFAIQQILISNCMLKQTKFYTKGPSNNTQLRYGGRIQLARIFHYLYDNSTIRLSRKFELFRRIVSDSDGLYHHPEIPGHCAMEQTVV